MNYAVLHQPANVPEDWARVTDTARPLEALQEPTGREDNCCNYTARDKPFSFMDNKKNKEKKLYLFLFGCLYEIIQHRLKLKEFFYAIIE